MFNEEAYLDRRIKNWQRLETLLATKGGRVSDLSGIELVEAVRLYRQASGDLAYLSTHSSNADVVNYLNNLVGRAYMEIYRHASVNPFEAFSAFLSRAARTVRTYSLYIGGAWAVLLAAFFFSFVMMTANPSLRPYFVSPGDEALHKMWMTGQFDARTSGVNMAMAAFYAQHNPSVAIVSNGASLASFGLVTLGLDWITGIQSGSLAADMNSVGKLGFFLSSIFPHGVSEIGGFTVISGASYLIAHAMIRPGRRTRGQALRAVGPDCAVLCMVSLIMILCAAPIEGFFSFSPDIPMWARIAVGCTAVTAWLSFFIGFGRNDPKIKHALKD